MKGLSFHIESALQSIIQGLELEIEVYQLDDDKLRTSMASKIASFNSAKKLLNTWVNSENAPSKTKVISYARKLVKSGDGAINNLQIALGKKIDFDGLDEIKYKAAIEAKPIILNSIYELDASVLELRMQIKSDNISLEDREFSIGYPEKYAKGEFFPIKAYYKDWHEEKIDVINICPFSTKGQIVVIENLRIRLPSPPKDKTKILFHDLPKKEQFWKRIEPKIKITPENSEANAHYILEEFRKRREGVWFMNNGKPTYITGTHYFALQHCKMLDSGGYMDFRIAQLNIYYFLKACIIDDRCLGICFLKSRRTGFTYIALTEQLDYGTSVSNAQLGITSKSDDDAQYAFSKLSYMFLNLPFYFRPIVRGREDSQKLLEFGKPSINTKEAKKSRDTNTDEYLNTKLDFQASRIDSYDGQKLDRWIGDEYGKIKRPNDAEKHLAVITPTMSPGGTIVGKALVGSTMGSMDAGGSQFKNIYLGSNVLKRNSVTKRTSTGLYSFFLNAQSNMEKFTDDFGFCHQEKPKQRTYNLKGELISMGSIDYLKGEEAAKALQGDKALNGQYRAYPRTIQHAFRDEAKDVVFNVTKIYAQIEHNEEIPETSRYTVGNFDWVDGLKDGEVVFNPNPNGRFKVAWMPSVVDDTMHLQNRVKTVNDKHFPMNGDVGRFGCDPFSLKSTHGKGSKGGLHGLTLRVPSGGAPRNKMFLEYLSRPSDETIFFEDVIKACRFYGMPILVESNRIDLLRHMRNRGYRGFALNRVDRPANKLNENEKEYGGQVMSGKDILDSHMNSIGSWIEDHVGVSAKEEVRPVGEIGDMPFDETLKDWLAFNPDKRTDYDATISSGLAIMACQMEKYKPAPKKTDPKKFRPFIRVFDNSGNVGREVIRDNKNYWNGR